MKRLVFSLVIVAVSLPQNQFGFAQVTGAVATDIGLTQLRTENPGLTEGVGVKAHLVESYNPGSSDRYVPDPSDSPLSFNTMDVIGFPVTGTMSDIYSNHARNSARHFFGTGGVARHVGRVADGGLVIDLYAAAGRATPTANTPTTDWLNGLILNGGADPALSAFDRMTVSSHSYVYSSDPGGDLPGFMQRLDFVINETDTTTVVGTANSGGLRPGWAPAYNVIAVGLSSGTHASGLTPSAYGAGRVAIDVVAPEPNTSSATPVVAGAVAILQDAANDTDAANSEVVRAIIMAGATKDAGDFVGTWSRTTTQPLDSVYGAGELNVLNSFNIQQGGEFNGGSAVAPVSLSGLEGWDYESNLLINGERFYEFTVAEDQEVVDMSIVLTWNLDVEDTNPSASVFTPTALSSQLANLSLELFNSTGTFMGMLEDSSVSAVDNVEHIYVPDGLTEGTYHIRVSNDATKATDYGLAWRGTLIAASVVPEPGTTVILVLVGATTFLCRRR